MKTRFFRAAAAAALALAAQAATAQAPVPEALVDRFVASLPDSFLTRTPDGTADPAQMARLTELNPDRADEIRPILEVYQVCVTTIVNSATDAAFRDIAQRLGSAKVARLTAFYRGPDFPVFKALVDRTDKGENLSDAEMATFARVMAQYPVTDLYTQFKRYEEEIAKDTVFITNVTKCSLAKKQALIRAKLRYN
ncbi:MAG: hypothetical protein ABWX67_01865 [Allosphingosinicella sp.]